MNNFYKAKISQWITDSRHAEHERNYVKRTKAPRLPHDPTCMEASKEFNLMIKETEMLHNTELNASMRHNDRLMQLYKIRRPIIQNVSYFDAKLEITFDIRRDDLLSHYLNGNKVWKLLPHIEQYNANYAPLPIVAVGGAYSNFLRAFAAACQIFRLPGIALVRRSPNESHTGIVRKIERHGVKAILIEQDLFRLRDHPEFQDAVKQMLGPVYLLPEGGSTAFAVEGVAATITDAERSYDTIVLPVGTGGTMAGVVAGLNGKGYVIGISVVKGDPTLPARVSRLLQDSEFGYLNNWNVDYDYTFQGFGRFTTELENFYNSFYNQTKIPLDMTYNAKSVYGIVQLIKSDKRNLGRVLLIHTGGYK